ncbi:MAG: tetratricopeptide repeat protein [Sphaerospermopsis sp. SIO1G1]|nr:tetratricopeptide repeat protein [Sphaerospermopsis sp. SIO1G1]
MNNLLDVIIARYEASLKNIDQTGSAIDIEQVLAVLNARDAVQEALKDEKNIPNSRLQKVIELDQNLRNKSELITKVINKQTADQLQFWRESIQPNPEAWWWKLDTIAPHPWDQLDWLWIIFSIFGWTANISLLANIATRFLGGGVGVVGAAIVTLPSILTLLQAGSQFTKTGQQGLDKLLENKIPKQYHQEVKLASTLMMSVALVFLWLALPSIAEQYNQRGLNNMDAKNLGTAEQDFLQAISLNKDNVEAHYNLGNIYEEWQDLKKAKKQYQLALSGDLPEAYNNLARLYIQDKKYPQAAALLQQGLGLAQKKNSYPEIKYRLFKNFGWVRLKQGRNEEAQQNLQAAIGITKNPESVKYIKNPGAVHCLLAQVLENQPTTQKPAKALQQWQKCAQLGSTLNPDEDTWLHIARQKIRNQTK